MEVITRLLQFADKGKLARGTINSTATETRLHRTTVSKIWHTFRRNARMPSSRPSRVGLKMVYTKDHVTNLVMGVPDEQQATLSDMSVATGTNIGTHHRKLRVGTIERKSSQPNPLLTDTVESIEFWRSRIPPAK
ncbi:hypothetical protein H310_03888 [Aphanomyces invadans]|uniref:Transposase Tc1-like domain-containing protein n=1 Tax=Aphanomyces invadans TaxID=157072 RepID=A0A024UEN5_9STRA|nr:hypothetical protein H310_03888 [Aphanomyces invadans]ETW04739.1 hypothetical protein H310_03888 [Aphanomyces invadans]|eukprot:XP_008866177.1 hypothetical protein H310_03888 [Aphanomyces invadans]